jgi:hypothetical protein
MEKQDLLFETPSFYDEHWAGMPEFIQEKKQPYSKIIIRFESESDLKEFAELVGQRLTKRTKSMWFPFKSHWREGVQPKWVSDE